MIGFVYILLKNRGQRPTSPEKKRHDIRDGFPNYGSKGCIFPVKKCHDDVVAYFYVSHRETLATLTTCKMRKNLRAFTFMKLFSTPSAVRT